MFWKAVCMAVPLIRSGLNAMGGEGQIKKVSSVALVCYKLVFTMIHFSVKLTKPSSTQDQKIPLKTAMGSTPMVPSVTLLVTLLAKVSGKLVLIGVSQKQIVVNIF